MNAWSVGFIDVPSTKTLASSRSCQVSTNERRILLAALDRFLGDDTVVALELLALDADKYPELWALNVHLYGLHLAIAVLKMRIMGYEVAPIPQGYIFAPPK